MLFYIGMRHMSPATDKLLVPRTSTSTTRTSVRQLKILIDEK